jgi:hypothetical protein
MIITPFGWHVSGPARQSGADLLTAVSAIRERHVNTADDPVPGARDHRITRLATIVDAECGDPRLRGLGPMSEAASGWRG